MTIIRTLVTLLLFASVLTAAHTVTPLLDAHATILPRILMLDQKLQDRLVDGRVDIVVVHEAKDLHLAQDYCDLVRDKYGDRLGPWPLNIILVPAGTFDASVKATALYLFPLTGEKTARVCSYCIANRVLSFAYNVDDLAEGALFSLRIESKTVIYFNRKAWNPEHIQLHPGFFKVVRSYE